MSSGIEDDRSHEPSIIEMACELRGARSPGSLQLVAGDPGPLLAGDHLAADQDDRPVVVDGQLQGVDLRIQRQSLVEERRPSAPAEAPPSAPAVSTPEAMFASEPVHASVAEPPMPPSSAPAPAVPVPEPVYTPRPRSGPLAPARSPEPDADARLAEETRRLTAARTALDAGRPGLALEVLRAHARDFPRSPLAEARGALRVEVLCVQGKGAQARGEAQVLLRHHPESNLARHAVTRCRDSP